ncbi:uncharacterized protein C16orf96 homolog [Physella acuta]|uniref:uncharacterized protein C16orf96 homolog n=1 Tax=Physella acuta TaxID=109671 RepID=UPI0027DC8214|nr:uncharacterized protein C16orf96 homolog [Physella acuta]
MPTVPLSQLVDLALGSPEVGAVNFNVLHTLLHAMLEKLNLQDVKADIDEHDRELLSTHPRAFSAISLISADSGKGEDSFSEDNSFSEKSAFDRSKHSTRSPYHKLEAQVANLTKMMNDLSKLPSNEELLSRTQGKESERPVSDMWQAMQLKKRIESNEEGVSKLMSLVEDMMKEMKNFKDTQNDIMKKIKAINLDEVNSRLNAIDDLLKELNNKYAGIADRISKLPPDLNEQLSLFVTWPALEDALKGIQQDFANLQVAPQERVVIELGTQTATPEPKSRPVSRASSAGPSAELLDLLEKLGKLSSAHDELNLRIDKLEELINLKADKADLEGIGISSELMSTLKDLESELNAFREGHIKNEAAVRRLQEALQKLMTEVEHLQNSVRTLQETDLQRELEIQNVKNVCDGLKETKADKEYVDMEVIEKADKRQLESKVNHSLFDSTTNELNRMIRDILEKLNGKEEDWRSALSKAMEELDGKLDRRELNSLRSWLEEQLKALNNKMKAMGSAWQIDEEAAGMKKQLIQRFHCLSCDKPLDVMPHPPISSIPASYGLPMSRSPGPYTSLQLDLIRQQAKSFAGNNEWPDYYSTVRQCGGSHTLTLPHKRTTKLNLSQLLKEEETVVPLYKEEVNIQGADGHVYKGRMDSSRQNAMFPGSLTGQHTQPAYMEAKPNRPVSALRPKSGRPTSSRSAQKSSSETEEQTKRPGTPQDVPNAEERNQPIVDITIDVK